MPDRVNRDVRIDHAAAADATEAQAAALALRASYNATHVSTTSMDCGGWCVRVEEDDDLLAKAIKAAVGKSLARRSLRFRKALTEAERTAAVDQHDTEATAAANDKSVADSNARRATILLNPGPNGTWATV